MGQDPKEKRDEVKGRTEEGQSGPKPGTVNIPQVDIVYCPLMTLISGMMCAPWQLVSEDMEKREKALHILGQADKKLLHAKEVTTPRVQACMGTRCGFFWSLCNIPQHNKMNMLLKKAEDEGITLDEAAKRMAEEAAQDNG